MPQVGDALAGRQVHSLTLSFSLCSYSAVPLIMRPAMRKASEPESLYLDFDGFFASCEQSDNPRLRGRAGLVS